MTQGEHGTGTTWATSNHQSPKEVVTYLSNHCHFSSGDASFPIVSKFESAPSGRGRERETRPWDFKRTCSRASCLIFSVYFRKNNAKILLYLLIFLIHSPRANPLSISLFFADIWKNYELFCESASLQGS